MSKPAQVTPRTMKLIRERGGIACNVEKWIPMLGRKVRQDAFGFGDVLASFPGFAALVQTTTGANAAARVTKIVANPLARRWLEHGNRIVVHSWAKRGERGKRKLWTCVERAVTLADFPATPKPQEATDAR